MTASTRVEGHEELSSIGSTQASYSFQDEYPSAEERATLHLPRWDPIGFRHSWVLNWDRRPAACVLKLLFGNALERTQLAHLLQISYLGRSDDLCEDLFCLFR